MIEAARVAEPADVDRLVALAIELRDELRVMRGGALWEARESRVRPVAETFEVLLARGDALVLVGTIDDVVVGYATVEFETLADGRTLAVIGDLYVEPDARAVGVGEALVTDLVERAVAAGCIGMDAFALPGHRQTKNFFERSGFTARALVMHKPLTEPG